MKKHFLSFILLACSLTISAFDYDDYFIDKTLRLDYIFAGNSNNQYIFLDELKSYPQWYGRKINLDSLALEGNGQIIMRSHRDGKILYKQSFSTLFQEWITYDEAKETSRSFENVFLVPFPRQTVDITVTLFDNRRKTTAEMTHTVNPSDILIHSMGEHGITPFTVIQKPKDENRCIRIAYVAEGFTEENMGHFIDKANEATEALFAHEPFKQYRDRFEIVAVKTLSNESGTSTPSTHDWKKTALSSHFDTFYSDRYLTTLNIKDMHNALAGTPYDHIIVLVNTEKYGGGGIFNSYNLTSTDHRSYKPVVVHEFGHSFAGLADEYAYENEPLEMYPKDIEPWEKNITTMVDFESKWKDMVDMNHDKVHNSSSKKVGLFEGAGYSLKGVYRADFNCRMRTNEYPEFCPVCQKAITEIIEFYSGK